jgi:hypothetical protein
MRDHLINSSMVRVRNAGVSWTTPLRSVEMSKLITARDNSGRDNSGTLIGVRLQPNLLKALDKWNAGDFSRPEAIRQLVEFALIPKPGSLSLSSERMAAINSWVNKHEPGLNLPDAIAKLIEIGLKAKAKS